MDRTPVDTITADFPTPQQERLEERHDTAQGIAYLLICILIVGGALAGLVWAILATVRGVLAWLM